MEPDRGRQDVPVVGAELEVPAEGGSDGVGDGLGSAEQSIPSCVVIAPKVQDCAGKPDSDRPPKDGVSRGPQHGSENGQSGENAPPPGRESGRSGEEAGLKVKYRNYVMLPMVTLKEEYQKSLLDAFGTLQHPASVVTEAKNCRMIWSGKPWSTILAAPLQTPPPPPPSRKIVPSDTEVDLNAPKERHAIVTSKTGIRIHDPEKSREPQPAKRQKPCPLSKRKQVPPRDEEEEQDEPPSQIRRLLDNKENMMTKAALLKWALVAIPRHNEGLVAARIEKLKNVYRWLVTVQQKTDKKATFKTFKTTSQESLHVETKKLSTVKDRKRTRKEGNKLLRELDREEEDFYRERIGEVMDQIK